jgi:hypothetical protein
MCMRDIEESITPHTWRTETQAKSWKKSFITKDGGSYTASSLSLSSRGNCLPIRHYLACSFIQAKCRSSRVYNYNDAYLSRYEILLHRLRQVGVSVRPYCSNNSIIFWRSA